MKKKKQVQRQRPRISTTVSRDTLSLLSQIGRDTALSNMGITLDYIINDWVNLKRAALATAALPPLQNPDQPT